MWPKVCHLVGALAARAQRVAEDRARPLAAGASLDARTDSGLKPLHTAAILGAAEIAAMP